VADELVRRWRLERAAGIPPAKRLERVITMSRELNPIS